MRSILHCTRCKSRTVMDTDGNGHLVQTLNHACECPPVVFQPDYEDGGQPSAILRPKNTCVDCGMPISVRAKRCPVHAKEDASRRATLSKRTRRAREEAA